MRVIAATNIDIKEAIANKDISRRPLLSVEWLFAQDASAA